MANLEEASHCPKCGEAGRLAASNTGQKPGSTVYTYQCMNERCTWLGTGWVVQVLADGSIPERKPGPKQFEKLTPQGEALGRRYIEDIIKEDLRNTGER